MGFEKIKKRDGSIEEFQKSKITDAIWQAAQAVGGTDKIFKGRNLEYGKIRNMYEGNSNQEEYEIFSDGEFVKGKFNKFENQEMIKVVLDNNHELRMTKEHLNFVMREGRW